MCRWGCNTHWLDSWMWGRMVCRQQTHLRRGYSMFVRERSGCGSLARKEEEEEEEEETYQKLSRTIDIILAVM